MPVVRAEPPDPKAGEPSRVNPPDKRPAEAFWEQLYDDIARGTEHWDEQRSLETLLLFAVSPEKAMELSIQLLQRFGSLSGVLDAKPSVLEEMLESSECALTLLKLIVPLSRKALLTSNASGATKKTPCAVIRTAEDAKARMAPYFYGYTSEAVYALYVNGRGEVLDCRKVSQGSETLVNIDARRLAANALTTAAEGLYLAHNHPRGRPRPSPQDREITRRLTQELSYVGLTLLEHFIFADDQSVSLKEYEQREMR